LASDPLKPTPTHHGPRGGVWIKKGFKGGPLPKGRGARGAKKKRRKKQPTTYLPFKALQLLEICRFILGKKCFLAPHAEEPLRNDQKNVIKKSKGEVTGKKFL
jgi:hypothetical protein